MTVALLTTGVRFPDATVQTTAATTVPGVTARYGVIGQAPSLNSYGSSNDAYSINGFTPASLAAGTVYSGTPGNSTVNANQKLGKPFWSSYYNAWFCIMSWNISGVSLYGVFTSKDGLNWAAVFPLNGTIFTGMNTSTDISYSGAGGSQLAVDDSNGRFFLLYNITGAVNYAYSSITSTNSLLTAAGWTVGTFVGAASSIGDIAYCKMATTGASGTIAVVQNDSTSLVTVYYCAAGGTTFSGLISGAGPGTLGPGLIGFQENGSVVITLAEYARAFYNTSGNVSSSWATNASLPNTQKRYSAPSVGNGYMAFKSTTVSTYNLYYSTDGVTWTGALAGTAGTTLDGLVYNGSVWLAWSPEGSFISSTGVPSTWTLYSGGVNSNRYPPINFKYGQRVVA